MTFRSILVWGIITLLLAACGGAAPQGAPTPNLPPPSPPTPTSGAALISPTDLPDPDPDPDPDDTQTEESARAWQADLAFLSEQVREVHPNPFWRVSEEEFNAAVDALAADIPGLSDLQIALRLMEIASLIDGHTHLPLFQSTLDFGLYPIRLYDFEDGLFVVAAEDGYVDLVGARLVAVGELPAADAYAAVSRLVPRDNEMTVRLLAPVYLTVPEVLVGLGLSEAADRPGFVFEMPDGEQRVVDLAPSADAPPRDWTALFIELAGLPGAETPLHLSRKAAANFWFEVLEDGETLYLQYNQVQSSSGVGGGMTAFLGELENVLGGGEIARVVLDIRHNPGGNINAAEPLLNFMRDHPAVNRAGTFFVITGRQTFSAATLFAVDLERETEAVFVGEPTGGRPNLYADTVAVRLPNSGIVVWVSTVYWERGGVGDMREWIAPDVAVGMTSGDYFGEVDPVLEAILSQGP